MTMMSEPRFIAFVQKVCIIFYSLGGVMMLMFLFLSATSHLTQSGISSSLR